RKAETNKCRNDAEGECRAECHREDRSVDRVTHIRVGSSSDKLVVGLEHHCPAPVAADRDTRPDRKKHPEKGEQCPEPDKRCGWRHKPCCEGRRKAVAIERSRNEPHTYKKWKSVYD